MMNIIVDAMGGDNAPGAIVSGSVAAANKYGVKITLVGDESQIKKHLAGDNSNIKIVHAKDVITQDDDPIKAVREKTESSLVKGLQMLSDNEGDVFVSAGNTGALVTGTTLIIKRIKGIRRVALAPIIPADKCPTILVDGGANVDCSPEMLQQFALMGNVYAKTVLKAENPRVGLLNIGTEEHKGNEATVQTYGLLSQMPLNFIGNVEAREVLNGAADVLVADGFVGNMLIKSVEGTALYFAKNLKEMLTESLMTKICALMLKKGIGNFKKKFDYNEHGGAPVLGARAPVIKAHGSSGEVAFCNAIRQAISFCKADAVNLITDSLHEILEKNT